MNQFVLIGVLDERPSISDFYKYLRKISPTFPISVSEYQIWLGKHLPKSDLEKCSKKPNFRVGYDEEEWVAKSTLRLFGIPEDMIEKAYSLIPHRHLHLNLEVKHEGKQPQRVNITEEVINEFDHLHSLYITPKKTSCSICYRRHHFLHWYKSLEDLNLPLKQYKAMKSPGYLKERFGTSVEIGDPFVFVHTEGLKIETVGRICKIVVSDLYLKSYFSGEYLDNLPQQKSIDSGLIQSKL